MSKFKVGDWIINPKAETPRAYKIIEVQENYYKFRQSKNHLGFSKNLDNVLRLATKVEIEQSQNINDESSNNKSEFDFFWVKYFLIMLITAVVSYNFNPFFDNPVRERIGVICEDNSKSYATGSGACSHHGGVKEWLYREVPHKTGTFKKIIASIFISLITVVPIFVLVNIIKESINKS